jgi:hypothetical protein
MQWEKGRRGFQFSKVLSDGAILPLGVLEDDSLLQNSAAMHKFLSAYFVSSNPIHTALPQPSSSPVILNNTHKMNSHLLHKNIEILAAKAPKTVKPSRQEHPKTSSSSSCASSLRHKRVKC